MNPFDLDRWQEVGDALLASPVRTLLSMAGVFWGTFALVVMLGFGKGLETATERAVRGMATNAVFLWGGKRTMPFQGFPTDEWLELDASDVEPLRQLEGMRWLAPRNQLGGHRGSGVARRGPEAGTFNVVGDVPEMAFIETSRFDGGRFLDELDLDERRKVAVIGKQVAETLFADGADPMGDWIEIGGVPFKVVGLYHSARTDDMGDREEQTIHIPLTTFRTVFDGGRPSVQWFAAVAEDNVSASDLEDRMKVLLKERHHVHPDDDMAFGSFNAEREFGRIRRLFSGIRGTTWLVGSATLLSGAIGIGNVMLVVVRERTREIGVRRAVGATPRDIVRMILMEALVMTSLAGFAGLVAGVVLCELASAAIGPDNPSFGPPQVDATATLIAGVVLVCAGLLAGVLPARRAAAIHPVEALRSE
ncbi:MAG: ABC transporter permease [Alphaproteobacteria bacterium]|nr:ABC transporter permease [Alphaproteobacteria bacterium]MCB9698363.1 ABC transporter permease [Alphaproteobacteria bacterium]